MLNLHRRDFLRSSAAGAAALATTTVLSPQALRAAESPANKIVLGVMGVNGRGNELAQSFTSVPGVEIAYLCDVDRRALEKATKALAAKQSNRAPESVADFRRILDDKAIDGLVIAAPDHWHGPGTILGCDAKKHVYCEKPASHNSHEGELMIAAARKHERVVQLGTQRRSMPGIIEAIGKIRDGAIGKVTFSRAWYNNARGPIGRGKAVAVPEWLDYTLWQGPAPEREYRDNLIHYNWHWLWHWGTGELGNNGIHALDISRWGLDVESPTRVTSAGGKYGPDDDQETPDVHVVTYDFPGCTLVWEGRSRQRRGVEGSMFGIAFYGDKGSIVIDGGSYKQYDDKDKEVAKGSGDGGQMPHLRNWIDCIRDGKRPNADIEEGVRSTQLCHLGNIAHRVGRVLNLDSQTRKIVGDEEAAKLWRREYRQGWEPKV